MPTARRSRSSLYVAVASICTVLAQPTVYAQTAEPPASTPAAQNDPFALSAKDERALPAPAAGTLPDGKLDIEGMRLFVRTLPPEEAPSGPLGTVFSAAPAPELQRFQNRFDEGKRPWCLTAFQGAGVLALVAMPLAALLDKKDHGCKW